jgi:hypothetical protein
VVTNVKLETLLSQAPLSSSEIQNLIEILLNKEHVGDSDWVNNKKNDQPKSVAGLKKSIAKKDEYVALSRRDWMS